MAFGGCSRDAADTDAGPGASATATPADDADAPTRAAAPAPATRLGALRAETLPPGFAQVSDPITFDFPRDHGPHPAFRHEWWYVTGHLDAKSGEHFGFELTFFRFALAPPPDASTAPARDTSAWRTRQIYMAHFAVTDLDRKEFHATERFARDALDLSGAQAEPFRVWLDDWSLGTPPDESGANGSSDWQLNAADTRYSMDLQLRALDATRSERRRRPEPKIQRARRGELLLLACRASQCAVACNVMASRSKSKASPGSTANGAADHWARSSRAGTGSLSSSTTAARSCSTRSATTTARATLTAPAPGSRPTAPRARSRTATYRST